MFEKLLARAKDLGATDAKLIDVDQLVFDPRRRFEMPVRL